MFINIFRDKLGQDAVSIRRQSLVLSKKSKMIHIYEGRTVDLVELRGHNELIKDEFL